ncbi:MAG TPA: CO dehydrogenase/acetyl-CoA synthase complex subunit epsilon [Dehalococcoidia bacterium]|nr:CO dehydrogenase/acetyl-CoA synthase complex subunit epsilon [Dehalococcoidia bacterium]
MKVVEKKRTRRDEVDEIIRAEDKWEPIGHTPMPELPDLRNWDMRLLKTYKPFYAPMCDLCCFCTYGKCDLTGDKRGACGIDISTQQARVVLLACCMGMSAHGGHARHVLHYLIEKYGRDYKINLGDQVNVEAPHIRTVLGLKPETLGDLEKAMEYVESQLIHLISSLHTGQEGSALDYESKALHASMLDHVAMEVADIAQIAGFGYPASVADTPLVGLGWGAVDRTKPVVLLIGHNPVTAIPIVDYLNANGLQDKVEVAGICCTALEVTRYSDKARVVGPLSRQLFFIRCGIADVIVTDEQCIRTDVPIEAARAGTALVATSDKVCYGLEDVSKQEADEIVSSMLNQGKQVLILEPEKAAEVAVRVALELAPKRNKVLTKPEEIPDLAKDHRLCNMCSQVCPNLLPVGDAIEAAKNGDLQPLVDVFNRCIGCGKCDQECPRHVPIIKMMQAAASWETWKIRAGRGPVMDTEIRKVGAPIVLGTIPGVIAIVGCSNFPEEIDEVAEIAEEFAKRKYIVVLSGCSAMVAGMRKDKEGKTLYEKYPPEFDAGCIINVGSCVSNAHITGAAMKIANIFATLPLRGNYEVIADYVLNRVGACGLAWGAYSQKAASIATGCNRLGIPVVVGPHSSKYRRLYMSRKEEDDWTVMDGREKKLVDTQEPSPEHLITVVESKERAIVTMAKLCIRKNDTPQGRQIKLTHYISLHKQYLGTLPDDLHLFIRRASDIPIFFKKEVMPYLEKVGWQEKPVLSLPTLVGTYPSEVPIDAVVH